MPGIACLAPECGTLRLRYRLQQRAGHFAFADSGSAIS